LFASRASHHNYLERNVFILGGQGIIEPQIEQDAGRLIEKFIAIHENDVAPLTRIKLLYEPRPRSAGNLSRGNQIKVIQQNFPVRVGIEDGMVDSHSRLVQNGRDVVISTCSAGVNLVPLDLGAEIYPMTCWQLVFHPEILAEFESLLRVTAGADPVKSKPLKQRD
jgi:hypothetical protein